MLGNWSVNSKLMAGFGLAALVLVLIATTAYRNASRLIENDVWVQHSQQVRVQLAEVLSIMKDAETGQRGYLITGDDGLSRSLCRCGPGDQGRAGRGEPAHADNPSQQRRLAGLGPVIDGKMAELKKTIDLRRDAGTGRRDQGGPVQPRQNHDGPDPRHGHRRRSGGAGPVEDSAPRRPAPAPK